MTCNHLAHPAKWSIAKARELISYRPRYRSLRAIEESVRWMADHGEITV